MNNIGSKTLGVLVLIGGVVVAGWSVGVQAVGAQTQLPPLSGVTQNWDKKMPSISRFTILSAFGGAVVRDNETGLVWEKTLETTEMSWTDARAACADKDVGGRKGWRLPSMPELASLVDASVSPGPTLPLDHPFTNVQLDGYWSATTNAGNPTGAWLVYFDSGKVLFGFKTIHFQAWCVRGGMTNAAAY